VTPCHHSGNQRSRARPGSGGLPESSRSNSRGLSRGYSGYSVRSLGFGPGHSSHSGSRSRSRSQYLSGKARSRLDNSDSRSQGHSQDAAIGPTESQPVFSTLCRRPSATVSIATPPGRGLAAAAQ
jgi:hypothetical protein